MKKKVPTLSQRLQYAKPYRRRLLIIPEGEKTEKAYLLHAKDILDVKSCNLAFPSARESIPALIGCARKSCRQISPKRGDAIWIVLDHDPGSHTNEQFHSLAAWEKLSAAHHVALSSPRFELWLLLHFKTLAQAKKIAPSDHAIQKIIPGFKQFNRCKHLFTRETILTAIQRAQQASHPTAANPSTPGSTIFLLLNSMRQ